MSRYSLRSRERSSPSPAGASATAFTPLGALDFKSEPVGVASPPQTTALLLQCTNYIGFPVNSCVTGAIDPLFVDIKTPADYSTTNSCPAVLVPGSGLGPPGQTTKKKCKKKHKSAARNAKKKCKKK